MQFVTRSSLAVWIGAVAKPVVLSLVVAGITVSFSGRMTSQADATSQGIGRARTNQAPGACEVSVDKTAMPTSVLLGDEVAISLRVDAKCPEVPEPGRADIVLAIDRSASQVDNGTWDATKHAAGSFGNLVDYGRHQVAVMSFSGGLAPLLAPWTEMHMTLSSDGTAVKAALASLPTPPYLTGATNLTAAIEDAQEELTSTRARAGVLPVIVLLSDGGHNANTTTAPVDAAEVAKQAGTTIITIGLAVSDTAEVALRDMASRDSLYYPAPSGDDLGGIYEEIAGSVGGSGRLSFIDVYDYLSAGVEYVRGSAEPTPSDVGTNLLRWRLPELPESGWSARYRVRMVDVGEIAANKVAYVDYIDANGAPGSRDFPVPVVSVRSPEPSPTPGPTPGATPHVGMPTLFLPAAYREYWPLTPMSSYR